MDKVSKYFFDLNGYIVVRNVFTKVEVAAVNAVIDKNAHKAQERKVAAVRNTTPNTPLAGDGVGGRQDLGGILEWGEDSTLFRSVLDHSRLVPYYEELLGRGYRMDHKPFAILQNRGSEGFSLHGGTVDCATGEYNPELAYTCVNGRLHCRLLAVSVCMADVGPGDGGYVVVNGSHKANFSMPPGMIEGLSHSEFVTQPVLEAGDVLLFSEGTVHGARAWNSDRQRRTVLYRFAPPTCAYGRAYDPHWPIRTYDVCYGRAGCDDVSFNTVESPERAAELEAQGYVQKWGLTARQQSVLEPPFALRADRRFLQATGEIGEVTGADSAAATRNNPAAYRLEVCRRTEEKKEFDARVFGAEYF